MLYDVCGIYIYIILVVNSWHLIMGLLAVRLDSLQRSFILQQKALNNECLTLSVPFANQKHESFVKLYWVIFKTVHAEKRTVCLVAVWFDLCFSAPFCNTWKKMGKKCEVCLIISCNVLYIPWCLHLKNCYWVASHNHMLFKKVFQSGCWFLFFFYRNTHCSAVTGFVLLIYCFMFNNYRTPKNISQFFFTYLFPSKFIQLWFFILYFVRKIKNITPFATNMAHYIQLTRDTYMLHTIFTDIDKEK